MMWCSSASLSSTGGGRGGEAQDGSGGGVQDGSQCTAPLTAPSIIKTGVWYRQAPLGDCCSLQAHVYTCHNTPPGRPPNHIHQRIKELSG
jgi:hypothetical protein